MFRSIVALSLLFVSQAAQATPTLRYNTDVRGNFTVFGNTLGFDCASIVPSPVFGTADPNNCGNANDRADTAPDMFWESDYPATGGAKSDITLSATSARSTARLNLPANATVVYARLYWAAENSTATAGTTITFESPGSFSRVLTADANATAAPSLNGTTYNFYQSSAEVTSLIQTYGAAVYRAGNIASVPLLSVLDQVAFMGWSVMVVYSTPTSPPRNITIFDGLDVVASGTPINPNISGFFVPNQAGFDGTLGLVTYEGDDSITGDSFSFNGNVLSNAANPCDNFFNGTHSTFGNANSTLGDLPQLSGAHGSMMGMDIDVVDVSSFIHASDTTATLQGTSIQDVYLIGAIGVSISTFKPDFSNTTKSVQNLSESNSYRPGDVLEYTIELSNIGSDTATQVVLNDVIPSGLTYVPNSIRILSGYNIGAKTDAAGDDQASYASGTITVRLGQNANATTGGVITTSDTPQVLRFHATLNNGASGAISNQATVTSQGILAGQRGVGATTYFSGNGSPNQATSFQVDNCAVNSDCSGASPHCDTSQTPHVCNGCLTSSDCSGTSIPVCNTAARTCVRCLTNSDCGGPATCSSNLCTLTSPTITNPANNSNVTTYLPNIVGTANPNTVVQVSFDNVVSGTALVSSAGAWSYLPSTPLVAQNHNVTAVDLVGGGATLVTSGKAGPNHFSVVTNCAVTGCAGSGANTLCDVTTHACERCSTSASCPTGSTCDPNKECVMSTPATTITAPLNNTATKLQEPTITGTSQASATVNVLVDDIFLGTATANSSGVWSFNVPTNLTYGPHYVQAFATLISGPGATVIGTSSSTNTFTVTSGCAVTGDCNATSAAPACNSNTWACVRCNTSECPTGATCTTAHACNLAGPTVTSPNPGAYITNASPNLTGTAVAGSTVNIYVDNGVVDTTVADINGNWNFIVNTPLSVGSHTIYATSTVGSGVTAVSSVNSPTNTFQVLAGCLSSSDCSGATPYCNGITNVCGQCLNNTACSGSTPLCDTNINTCAACLQTSDCASGATCVNDACVLANPNILSPAAGSVTNVTSPSISGNSVANANVLVTLDGTVYPAVRAASNGNWLLGPQASLGYGQHAISAVATVGNGNTLVTSVATNSNFIVGCLGPTDCSSQPASPVCDTTAHTCARCNVMSDCPSGAASCNSQHQCTVNPPVVTDPNNGSLINVATHPISGTAPTGAAVVVTLDGNVYPLVVASNGNWTINPNSMALGGHTVHATATVGSGAGAVTSAASPNDTFQLIAGCLYTSDCASTPSTPACNTATHACVGCVTTANCATGAICSASACFLANPNISPRPMAV